MEKLGWFKFSPADWMMGRIQRTSYQCQAEFLRLCCIYWNKEGELSEETAQAEVETLAEMIDRKIIRIEEGDVIIRFLDEQIESCAEMKRKRAEAGRSGGLAKSAKSKQVVASAKQTVASAKQNVAKRSREEERREEERREENNNSTTLRGKVAPTSLSKRFEQAAKDRGIANPVEIAANGKITYTHRTDDPDTERKEELRKLKKERQLTEMERIELLRLSTDKELAPAIAKVKEVYDNFLGRDLQTHRKDGRLSVEGTYIAKIIREGYELKDFSRVLRAASAEIQSDPDKVRFYTTKGLFETVDKFTTHMSKTRELA